MIKNFFSACGTVILGVVTIAVLFVIVAVILKLFQIDVSFVKTVATMVCDFVVNLVNQIKMFI